MDDLYSKYKTASATTDSQAQKLMFIFDESIRLLYQAKQCMENGDIEGKYKKLTKVENVFHNLCSDSNEISDPQEAATIKQINNFFMLTVRKLQAINMFKEKIEEIDVVIKGISNIRDGLVGNSE